MKPIQRFEHTKLLIGQESFDERHWKALASYNQRNGNRFFTTLHNGILFNQYVGVLQVDNLTIEVLPKVDRSETNKEKWQAVLLEMLRECHWMQVYAHQDASLRIKHNSILDAYLEIFLDACERLLRGGLVKKYRQQEANLFALKGKLKFAEHINRNVVHQERFYTTHGVYDRNNLFNRILLKALRIIPKLTRSPLLKDKLGRLLLSFPEMDDINVSAKTFDNLVFDRKTERYKPVLEIAAMLLLNYRPDITGGRNHVLAILFDMNELWEEYFLRRLRRSLPEGWGLKGQPRKAFWVSEKLNTSKVIKPDIFLTDMYDNKVILDTKWKTPQNDIPADADLKQVFVYNEYWGAKLGILVYPQPEQGKDPDWIFGRYKGKKSDCVVCKVSVLKEGGGLNACLAQQVVYWMSRHIVVQGDNALHLGWEGE